MSAARASEPREHDAGRRIEQGSHFGASSLLRRSAALRGIDLTVGRDELLVVLGPSGAGKSTLLRVIAGLQPAAAGTVVIAGRDVTHLRPGRRNVSMVFQSYALFPHLTVAENIAFGLIVRDTPKALALQRAQEAATTAGCGHLLARRPGQLSGGERQRVALARAIVREPDVFLLDEPLSNLDLETRVETRAELKALHARVGGTMVHVTHDQTEALVLGDRIAVMRDGRARAGGYAGRDLAAPGDHIRGPLRGLTCDEPAARRWTAPTARYTVRCGAYGRPADRLSPRGRHARAPTTASPATVERVDVVGEDAYAYVRVAGLTVVGPGAGRRAPSSGRRGARHGPMARHARLRG